MPEFTVAVDFEAGTVTGFDRLAESIVEFVQEDRVTADDDLAMHLAEALAEYLRTGEVSQANVSLLVQRLTDWQDTPAFSDWALVRKP